MLDALGKMRDLPRKEVNAALRKVAKPIIRNARKNLVAHGNVRTGALKKSIKSLVISRKYPGLTIGPTYKGKEDQSAPYAHLIEFGTKKRKLKRPVLVNFNGTWALVKHTGRVRPSPYMQPAIEQSTEEIGRLAAQHISPIIQKQWRYSKG